MKKVYVVMSTDIIQPGHLNILNEASKLGDVVVGVLTDEAIASYKRSPLLNLHDRVALFKSMKNISDVVIQDSLDYTKNLTLYKPDFVVHGDDWREGAQKEIRQQVMDTLAIWGGELIEIPYSTEYNSSEFRSKYLERTLTIETRRSMLRTMLSQDKKIRVLEASNGLTGLIVENTKLRNKNGSVLTEFDAMWVSSLCDSTFKGKPDIELVDLTSRIHTINEIMEVTTKPIILDGDTGGKIEHFVFNVKSLERIGVSAIIVEDKQGLKRNSLYGTDVKQILEDQDVFAEKIRAGKRAQATRDFLIFARLESLIAGYDVDHAINRGLHYVQAGADGLMIHSKSKDGLDIIQFLNKIRKINKDIVIIVVPTTYNHIMDNELFGLGANIVIHANHLLRSAYPAMEKTAESILTFGRSKEADQFCLPIKDVLRLIPTGENDD